MSRRVLVTYPFISPSNMNSFFSKGRLTKNQAKEFNSISEIAVRVLWENFPPGFPGPQLGPWEGGMS